MNFKEILYFSFFSSVTSAALNTIHISYGMSYFRYRDSSDIFTYDIARQSVVDKMVREISLEVREKSGKSQGILFSHFCGNPDYTQYIYIQRMSKIMTSQKGVKSGVPEREHFLPHMWHRSQCEIR